MTTHNFLHFTAVTKDSLMSLENEKKGATEHSWWKKKRVISSGGLIMTTFYIIVLGSTTGSVKKEINDTHTFLEN